MNRIYKKTGSVKIPKARHEEEEFGKAKKGLSICKQCYAFYYKKSWHASVSKAKGLKLTNFVLCPACKMIKKGLYEGKIIIKDVPEKLALELVNLIKGFSERAQKRDILDKVIEIKKVGKGFVVTTTENQLAVKLAKKIKSTFNKVELKISYSKEPYDLSEVEVKFTN